MCGLVGAAGILENKDLTALAFLGTLSSLRGDHSTGLMDFAPTAKTAVKYVKSLEMPESFFKPDGNYYNNFYHQRYKNHSPTAVCVHTRYATVGNVSKANAHPFLHGDIIGMHNGTIRSEKLENRDKFETDSEALIYNLSVKGEDYLFDLERMFDAAYAVVWINAKKGTLNFVRNTQRPLHFLVSYDKTKMFWASDETWLKAVLPYFDIKGHYTSLAIDTLVTVPLNVKNPVDNRTETKYVKAYSSSSSKLPVLKDHVDLDKVTDYKELGTTYFRQGSNWFQPAGKYLFPLEVSRYWKLKDGKTIQQAAKHKEEKGDDNVIPFGAGSSCEEAYKRFNANEPGRVVKGKDGVWYFNTYANIYVNEPFYRKLLSCGCRGCDDDIQVSNDVRFLTARDYLCEKCDGDAIVRTMVEDEVEEEVWNQKDDKDFITPDTTKGEEEWGMQTGNGQVRIN